MGKKIKTKANTFSTLFKKRTKLDFIHINELLLILFYLVQRVLSYK